MRIMTFFSKLKKRERGVLLVDALIGVTILAVGLVALMQLFIYGTKNRADASLREKAVQIAAERIEILKAREAAGDDETNISNLIDDFNNSKTIALSDQESFTVTTAYNMLSTGTSTTPVYKGDDNIMVVSSNVEWNSPESGKDHVTLYTYILLNQK